tara:strand:- start:127 stop:1122 length:996 start_codon:yes stop_codon:yes gene_type:complete
MTFLKTKVLFRCDCGDVEKLGSGHLFRCITIARYLEKKLKINKKDITFAVKVKKNFSNSIKIIKKFSFKIFKVDNKIKDYSNQEAKMLSKIHGDLIIIDRWGKINKSFIKTGLKQFKKKVIIDDASIHRKYFDLSYNPLMTKIKKCKNNFIGIKNHISPIYFYQKRKYNKNDGVFVFLGNYDKNEILKKIFTKKNILKKIKFLLPEIYRKKLKSLKINHNIHYFKVDEYYKCMQRSKFVILSAGMSVFDALYLKKNIICIPQYKHEIDNLYTNKIQDNLILIKKNQKDFNKKLTYSFNLMDKSKKFVKKKSLFNKKSMNLTLSTISKLIYE